MRRGGTWTPWAKLVRVDQPRASTSASGHFPGGKAKRREGERGRSFSIAECSISKTVGQQRALFLSLRRANQPSISRSVGGNRNRARPGTRRSCRPGSELNIPENLCIMKPGHVQHSLLRLLFFFFSNIPGEQSRVPSLFSNHENSHSGHRCPECPFLTTPARGQLPM